MHSFYLILRETIGKRYRIRLHFFFLFFFILGGVCIHPVMYYPGLEGIVMNPRGVHPWLEFMLAYILEVVLMIFHDFLESIYDLSGASS